MLGHDFQWKRKEGVTNQALVISVGSRSLTADFYKLTKNNADDVIFSTVHMFVAV
jgi:hypothetical protein